MVLLKKKNSSWSSLKNLFWGVLIIFFLIAHIVGALSTISFYLNPQKYFDKMLLYKNGK